MGTSSQNLIVLKELVGNAPSHLDRTQQLLAPHIQLITHFWIGLWLITAIVVLVKVFREYIAYRKKAH